MACHSSGHGFVVSEQRLVENKRTREREKGKKEKKRKKRERESTNDKERGRWIVVRWLTFFCLIVNHWTSIDIRLTIGVRNSDRYLNPSSHWFILDRYGRECLVLQPFSHISLSVLSCCPVASIHVFTESERIK